MELVASHDPDNGLLIVEQHGGYSPENKILLRTIAQHCTRDRGIVWKYPWSEGAVLALVEIAQLLEADLVMDDRVKAQVKDGQDKTQREQALRKIFQQYMDKRAVALPEYACRQDPPPWRHQAIAYHWGVRSQCLYLAHKPGLGKTREGADIIRGKIDLGEVSFPENVWVPEHISELTGEVVEGHWAIRGGVLIVCPKIVLGTWKDELLHWQGLEGVIVNSYNSDRVRYRSGIAAWVHICTYGSLVYLEDNQYDGIIADEAHFLANEETTQFQRTLFIRRKCAWALALSGTPVSNMLPSLWSQFFWLDGGRTLGASFESYRRQYFDGTYRKMEPKASAAANIAKRISRVTYFLTMQEAFPDKPHKIQQVVRVPMTQEQIRYYDRVRRQTLTDVLTGTVTATEINTRLNKLLQICQGFVIDDQRHYMDFTSAKLQALKSMLTGQGDLTDRRTVVWVNFRHDLNLVVKMLQKAKVPVIWLHGDLNARDRDRVKEQWNNDSRWRVLVGMIQIGIGINLNAPACVDGRGVPSRCSTTVFYGLNWRVTQLEQAMDRVYRGNQVETCLYRYLLSEDVDGLEDENGETLRPIDRRVYDLLQIKLEQATEISEESVSYVRQLLGAA